MILLAALFSTVSMPAFAADSSYSLFQKGDPVVVCSQAPRVNETIQNVVGNSHYRILGSPSLTTDTQNKPGVCVVIVRAK